jgi:hypothetical protein
MNGTTISSMLRFTNLLGSVGTWIVQPTIQVEIGEVYSFRTLMMKLVGGLFRFVIISFVKPDHSGIQLCFGISRFHFDVDFIFIFRPEDEIRRDKRLNNFTYTDESIDYRSWFVGYEGVGLYRKYSLAMENGISQIEFGAHPLCCLGLTNVSNPLTQHAIVGIQFANIQLSIHSALDSKLAWNGKSS